VQPGLSNTVTGFELTNPPAGEQSALPRRVYCGSAKPAAKPGHHPDQPSSESFASACRDNNVTK